MFARKLEAWFLRGPDGRLHPLECVLTDTRKEERQMPLDEKLLEILVCPQCKGELEYRVDDEELVCHACRLKYRIEDDIPIMLVDEAESF